MKRYFILQCKRIWKILPLILGVTLALLLAVGALLWAIMPKEDTGAARFKIGITGDTSNEFIELGVGAFQTLDSSRFTIDFILMEEEEAKEQFFKGAISAYVILPENFIEKALRGDLEPLQYVTSSGESGLVPIVKYEITEAITDLLIYSEKGTYGFAQIGEELGMSRKEIVARMDEISLEYVALIIHRSELYEVEILGVADGQSLGDYYICGLCIFFFALLGLPFAAVMIRKDSSLRRMLSAKGHRDFKQLLCDYAAHCGALILLAGLIFGLLGIGLKILDFSFPLWSLFWRLLPALLMLGGFNTLIYEAAGSMVSGILIHFLLTLGLGYISGCLYPLFSFPVAIQKLAPWLPAGAARLYLGEALGYSAPYAWAVVLGYALLFLLAAQGIRRYKLQRRPIG